jgi:hypothetical protein
MKTPNLNDHYLAPSMIDDHQGPPSIASTLRDIPKPKTPSVPDLSRPPRAQQPIPAVIPIPTSTSFLPSAPAPLNQEDIRLCTINRADPQDTFGIELNYHKKEQFHSLSITPGRDNGPSSKSSPFDPSLSERASVCRESECISSSDLDASQAGIRSDDRLIEINGQNVQNRDHDYVTQMIRSVKYPDALQMLVADVPTYEYYRQQQKLINRGLPNVRTLPPNIPMRSASPSSSSHRCKRVSSLE